jgi:hypothetical protein
MGAALGQRIAEGKGMSAMTTEQKIIKAKIGLLELTKQLGNVSQACKVMGYRWGIRPVPPALAVLRFRLMVKRGLYQRPQASGEAQHETLCRVGCLRQRNLDLHR